jgi:hypothetical protein
MDIIPDNSGFASNKAGDTSLRSKVFFVRSYTECSCFDYNLV